MVLNNKELRTIERALGMVIGVCAVIGGEDSATLLDAVEIIDDTLGMAEAREKEEKREAEEKALEYQKSIADYLHQQNYGTAETSVHNLHNAQEEGQ